MFEPETDSQEEEEELIVPQNGCLCDIKLHPHKSSRLFPVFYVFFSDILTLLLYSKQDSGFTGRNDKEKHQRLTLKKLEGTNLEEYLFKMRLIRLSN